jgi:hypothetical protein
MKKINLLPALLIFSYCLFTACNTATPETYFDRAVLNSNSLVEFSNGSLLREMEQPSRKLVPGTKDQSMVMPRKEVVETRIMFIEQGLDKLKALKETPETKEMLQTSIALHEYVLPVYKKEYLELAKLYDDGSSQQEITPVILTIKEKYLPRFQQLYDQLIGIGKVYAQKNNITVNWAN